MTILRRDAGLSAEQWLSSAQEDGAALLVDKDVQWTSFDVVAKLRNLVRIRKIGHAGTLDPLATGLLIICCGKATKSIDGFQAQDKEYVATVKFGATTETYDSEMEEQPVANAVIPTEEDLRLVLPLFVGDIKQVPPMFSARKIGGKRLYQLARKGKEVEREAGTVHIESIDIVTTDSAEPDTMTLRIRCSKGTYIRSLAHDIGQRLGCGAYLKSLRRTAIGDYTVSEAFTMTELEHMFRAGLNGMNGINATYKVNKHEDSASDSGNGTQNDVP